MSVTRNAGEVSICDTTNGRCVISEPSKHAGLFCTTDATSSSNCKRYQEFQALYDRGSTQHTRDVASAQERANSVVFNLFIFLQVGIHQQTCNINPLCCMPWTMIKAEPPMKHMPDAKVKQQYNMLCAALGALRPGTSAILQVHTPQLHSMHGVNQVADIDRWSAIC